METPRRTRTTAVPALQACFGGAGGPSSDYLQRGCFSGRFWRHLSWHMLPSIQTSGIGVTCLRLVDPSPVYGAVLGTVVVSRLVSRARVPNVLSNEGQKKKAEAWAGRISDLVMGRGKRKSSVIWARNDRLSEPRDA
jgi:hypothetical protein